MRGLWKQLRFVSQTLEKIEGWLAGQNNADWFEVDPCFNGEQLVATLTTPVRFDLDPEEVKAAEPYADLLPRVIDSGYIFSYGIKVRTPEGSQEQLGFSCMIELQFPCSIVDKVNSLMVVYHWPENHWCCKAVSQFHAGPEMALDWNDQFLARFTAGFPWLFRSGALLDGGLLISEDQAKILIKAMVEHLGLFGYAPPQ